MQVQEEDFLSLVASLVANGSKRIQEQKVSIQTETVLFLLEGEKADVKYSMHLKTCSSICLQEAALIHPAGPHLKM